MSNEGFAQSVRFSLKLFHSAPILSLGPIVLGVFLFVLSSSLNNSISQSDRDLVNSLLKVVRRILCIFPSLRVNKLVIAFVITKDFP